MVVRRRNGRSFSSLAGTKSTPTKLALIIVTNWPARALRPGSRIPGPVDPRPLHDQLVDGAWAGRFAHRLHAYKDPKPEFVERIRKGLKNLDDTYRAYPDLKGIYKEYPELDHKEALTRRYQRLKGRREISGGLSPKRPTRVRAAERLKPSRE